MKTKRKFRPFFTLIGINEVLIISDYSLSWKACNTKFCLLFIKGRILPVFLKPEGHKAFSSIAKEPRKIMAIGWLGWTSFIIPPLKRMTTPSIIGEKEIINLAPKSRLVKNQLLSAESKFINNNTPYIQKSLDDLKRTSFQLSEIEIKTPKR